MVKIHSNSHYRIWHSNGIYREYKFTERQNAISRDACHTVSRSKELGQN